jgi:hypothetical protein
MKNILLLGLALILVSFGCQNEKKTDTNPETSSNILEYPPLPREMHQELFQRTIAIDVIAYEMGLSMTYDDPASIQPVLAFITPKASADFKNCKSVGRISFMYDSGLGQEAELLVHKGCRTLIWLENGKKKYANFITHEGSDFFNRFIPENPADFKMPENSVAK